MANSSYYKVDTDTYYYIDSAGRKMLAPEYTDLDYPVSAGQHCVYYNKLYRAKQAIASSETWNAGHWDEVVLTDEVARIQDEIGDLNDLETTDKSNLVAAINEAAQSGGGGGTSNYNYLSNKPQIAGVTLSGNKSLNDLGVASATDFDRLNADSGDYFATKRDLLENAGEYEEMDVSSEIETDKCVYIDTNYDPPVLKTYTAQWFYNVTLDVAEEDSFELDLYSTGNASTLFYAFVDMDGGVLSSETFGVSSDTHITGKVITAPANAAALRFNYFGYRDMSVSKRRVKPMYSKGEIDALVRGRLGALEAHAATLTGADEIALAPPNIKAGYTLSFRGRISSLNSLKLEYGYNKAYAHSYIVLDDQDLVIHNHRYTDEVTTVQHGIDLDDEVSIDIKVYHDATADIVLTSESGQYKTSAPWIACYGNATVSVDGSLTDCHLRWSCDELKMDLWAFGDSYFDSWPLIAEAFGFANFLIDGWSGRGSADALSSLQKSLLLYKPKKILWCLGMNDADSSSAVNATWKSTLDSVISICEEKGIELILCTIPNTPTVNHSFKNEIVRNSGYRYVDVCSAVGADISTSWYPGLLGSDNVHPTNPKGRQVIAGRFMADVPEIAGNPDLRVIEREVSELKTEIGDLDDLETTDKTDLVSAINEAAQSGGSGGTSNYNDLSNKPQIGGVTLSGNKSLTDLGIHNVPAGGSSGQVLSKASGTDYDLAWVNQSGGGSVDLFYVTPEQFGAVGDGVTDDSQAVQDACDAGYAVYFGSGKTYYLASTVTIDHDCRLFGGEGATIKTKTPTGGTAPNGIVVTGTLKKTTTLTTDYTSNGDTANCGNKFTLADMTGIAIGDIMVIEATDQYYNYARSYYYLGATLLVTDIYDDHIYTNINMPFDIENTVNVSVKVYSAPTAIVDGLKFISDLDSVPSYRYLMTLQYCKCSEVNNCEFTQMANGLALYNCVNTKISAVIMSKSKWDNTISGDGYGLRIDSSTNTVVERMIATCAQHAITISGNLPAIDTYIRYCNLTAECRSPGLDTHESVYNLVVEDSTLGTLCLNSVATVNRCRIIGNRRVGNNAQPLPIYGSHIADRSKIRFSETVFEPGIYINALAAGVQDPIQAFDNVFGSVEIVNCTGGYFAFNPSTSSTILSNTINHLLIDNWSDVTEIFHSAGNGAIKLLEIRNTTFGKWNFISDNNDSHGIIYDGIERVVWDNALPVLRKSTINRTTMGELFALPGGVPIQLTSNNSSAKFRICGANVTPNVIDDYLVGTVTGNDGAAMVRSAYAGSDVSLSLNGDGDLVYTQGRNTSAYCIYPIGMYKCLDKSNVSISAILQNAGQTNGAKFTPYVAVIDGATGLIRRRNSGSSVEATAQGAELTHTDGYAHAGDYVLPYIRCSTAYANAVTIIKDLTFTITSSFAPSVVNEDYTAVRRTGDGTLLSLPGVNNICCSENTFTVKFEADLAYNPIWQLPSASGVNF